MAAAAIFAFLPGAQVCGQSPRHGGGSQHSSISGGSHSSSHSSTYSHGPSSSSHSRSGSSVSGSSHSRSGSAVSSSSQSHRSSGSVSHSRPERSSGSAVSASGQHRQHSSSSVSGSGQSHRSSGSVSGQSRPSGHSDRSSHSGSVSSQSRPSSHSGSVGKPSHSSGDVRDRAARVSDGHGEYRHETRPGSVQSRPNVSNDRRPDVQTGGARRAGGYNDGVYRNKHNSSGTVHHDRPAPGSRPYADGAYGRSHNHPAPARVHPNPGAHRPAARTHVPREFHGTPSHFSHRGHHGYGHYVPTPPPHYVVRHYWGRDYYYYNDIWYRYYAGRYWVCRPPWGYVFSPLADAVYTACTFAYYFDRIHYYDTINENASTIVAQNETIAANNAVIAAQNETIARNAELAQASGDLARNLGLVQSYADAGTEYFYNDGVFYVKGSDGQYTVIVPPAGALVDSLPEDYETIEIGGDTYFKVDDTIYRTSVVDGKACFEVLGQLMQ
ncbi:MAG: hypothetical protein IK031_00270 [Bacteroidales bacterium]|nr:hypothetical protein [Bacteroidales bacterium]